MPRTTTIPTDKAETVRKLDSMKGNDWGDIQTMSVAELDALIIETANASVPELDRTHPHNRTIKEALRVLKDRRDALALKQGDANREQGYRLTHIKSAADLIKQAMQEIDLAHRVARDPSASVNVIPEPFKPIDAQALTDEMLENEIKRCKSVLYYGQRLGNGELIGQLKAPGAKDIAAELKEDEGAILALLKSARGNIDAAQRELDERTKEKAAIAAQDAEIMANLPSIIRELRDTVQPGAKR